jgi:Flp pilus assembly protein TadG
MIRHRPPFGPRRTTPPRRAAVAVEFALVLPFLMILVLGMFEIGRGIMVKEFLSDASQKGCRTGALPGKTNADILNDVADIMADSNVTGYTVTVLVNGVAGDVTAAQRFDQVSVKVSVPTSQVFWVSVFILKASTVESETVVMMRQG